MKFALTGLCGLAVSIAVAQQSWNYRIPKLLPSDHDLAFAYNVEQTEARSKADYDALVAQKRQQYDEMVREGKMGQREADGILQSMQSRPLNQNSKRTVSFAFSNGRLLVVSTPEDSKQQTCWTLQMGDYSVEEGWQGGDGITLTDHLEPYTAAVTKIPILPFQFPGLKVFVDMAPEQEFVSARMISVSAGREDYLTCRLIFSPNDGLLRSAEIPGIEKWTYDDYSAGKLPIPGRITMERLYNTDGKPQVVSVFTRTTTKFAMPSLDDLIKGISVTVVDRRSDPIRQFTYVKGQGSLLDQAKGGIPDLPDPRPQGLPGPRLTVGGLLVVFGCLLLLGVSLYGLFKRRSASPAAR